jgi:hypothetical protein
MGYSPIPAAVNGILGLGMTWALVQRVWFQGFLVRCSGFNRKLHSRMLLILTPARLKLLHACDQWHSSRVFTLLLPVGTVNSVQTRKDAGVRANYCWYNGFEDCSFTYVAIGIHSACNNLRVTGTNIDGSNIAGIVLDGGACGARFPTEICTRGCHGVSRLCSSA